MSIVGGGAATPSNDELVKIAQLLADPDRLAAEYAQLQQARADAERIINLVGTANEIVAVKAETYADREAAKVELARAHVEAQRLIDEAHAEALETDAATKASAEEIINAAEKIRTSALEQQAAALEAQRSVSAAIAEASAVKLKAESDIEAANEAVSKFNAKYAECVKLQTKLEKAQQAVVDALR